ncbi:MAG: AlkA N-terminal domain-containing protein [Parvibaculaceae bacterium]|nr:AlkA N-terminal domain-containing protein [Parvibaculaceae bacterium]
MPPSSLRGRTVPGTDGIELKLGYRAPFSWDRLIRYLAYRAIPGVEAVENGCYIRSFRLGGAMGTLTISHDPARHGLRALVRCEGPVPIRQIGARLRRLFDLDADPLAIHQALARHEALAPWLDDAEGLRIPGAFDGFELAVRAVLGQQVSVRGMVTLSARLAERCGARLPETLTQDSVARLFPTPAEVAAADLSSMGLTGARAATLKRLAEAAMADPALFAPRADLPATIAALKALPGIGDWTANYIALRAVGEPDAFPAGDLALRKAFGAGGDPLPEREVALRAEGLRPWRGYAAMLIWQSDPARRVKTEIRETENAPD